MHLLSEKDIDGPVAKALRERHGLTQRAFWRAVGLSQSGGCRYEQGQAIPQPIRILLFALYVAGLKLDATTPEGAAELARLAQLQASERAADREKIGATLIAAQSHIARATGLLAGLSN